ncbi:unnamed protein product [Dibothriocephalus latus]|uniref:Uncharacterized protein n=1 Tax=Dibothriocephalus latus TaxID=60516 RepID=A0A3P7LBT6_DIBLA|nr:unnamed protein product [Dibothriocephalus latus]
MLCDQLKSKCQCFDGREISSAIKLYVLVLFDSLLDADAFASDLAADLEWCLRTPAGLARTLWRMLAALTACIDCLGGKKVNDREGG